jgi:Cu/Ag efflux protein CusF
MRILVAAFAALTISTAAFAAEAEGQIKKIDADKQIITLDDGKSYKLPGEFDVATLNEGMDIVIAYDKVNGENLITDMQIPE